VLRKAKIWWSSKALPWLKKNWKWVVFPIGILLLLANRSRGPQASSELAGAAKAAEKINKKAEVKAAEAAADLEEGVADAVEEHDEVVLDLIEETKKNTDEIRKDPEKVNKFLKGVSDKVRK
jgi:hypothetical protein